MMTARRPGWSRLHRGQRPQQHVEALHRHEPADGHHQRRRRALAARREAGVDARAAPTVTRSARRPSMSTISSRDDFGQRDDPARAVEARREPALDQVAQAGQRRRQDHAPHLCVDVVQEDDARPPVPERREEGHAVPDLDQGVAGAVPHADALPRRAREDRVAPGSAQHPVAVAGRARSGAPGTAEVRKVTSRPGARPTARRPCGRAARSRRPRGRRGRARRRSGCAGARRRRRWRPGPRAPGRSGVVDAVPRRARPAPAPSRHPSGQVSPADLPPKPDPVDNGEARHDHEQHPCLHRDVHQARWPGATRARPGPPR